MKNTIFTYLLFLTLFSCQQPEKSKPIDKQQVLEQETPVKMTLPEARKLAQLPLKCIEQEYPNKLSQVLNDDTELKSPQSLHPIFYGCFDWHSAVHGHWSLVKLAKSFPELEKEIGIKKILLARITPENIAQEIKFFDYKNNESFERTYGWAWLLKLAAELHTWDDPQAKELEKNLQPLTALVVDKFKAYLPKLHYPIRVGTHTNTAFALSFAYDYAKAVKDVDFQKIIEQRAKDFYANDIGCPLSWEPSGHDFLSPCFEEVDIMRKVLPREAFMQWITKFMPNLKDKNFTMEPGIVTDRTDGHLVHLDGLNFSRAWVFYGLANQYPEFKHLNALANEHIKQSYGNLIGDDYMGGHWLASFAIYALSEAE